MLYHMLRFVCALVVPGAIVLKIKKQRKPPETRLVKIRSWARLERNQDGIPQHMNDVSAVARPCQHGQRENLNMLMTTNSEFQPLASNLSRDLLGQSPRHSATGALQ
ncbi:hypothetical protein G7054_g12979 [Neopestalotiopsis clavispora]|nr:hypothetical protein G7054_g12979 [Neopestalotiopsis clavispora]